MKPMRTGVPQGFIIGPILYNVYINDLPKISKDHDICEEDTHNPGEKLFNRSCKLCGNVTIFADDAVYTTSSKQIRSDYLKCYRLKEYLNNHMMTVNPSKMVLWEFMVRQKALQGSWAAPLTSYPQ